jgi:hypothetical protein
VALVKLADGTWLVGDRPSGLQADFNESEITPADLRRLKLDPERVVTVGHLGPKSPILSKRSMPSGLPPTMPGKRPTAAGGLYQRRQDEGLRRAREAMRLTQKDEPALAEAGVTHRRGGLSSFLHCRLSDRASFADDVAGWFTKTGPEKHMVRFLPV